MHANAILPQVKVLLSYGLIATSSQVRTALNVIVSELCPLSVQYFSINNLAIETQLKICRGRAKFTR